MSGRAQPVDEVGGMRGVEDDGIGAGSGRETADVGALQGGGAAAGRGQQCLLDGQPALPHGQRQGQGHRRGVAGAGVAVAGQSHGGAGVEQGPAVRIRLPGAEVADREQGGDRGPTRERLDVGGRQMGAVVRGCRTEFAGEGNPPPRSQLVGVNTQPHAVPARRLQHRPRLVCVEGALLAEDVAPAGRPGRGRDHGLRQQAQVAAAVPGELGGHEVGAKEGGFGREGASDAQVGGFVVRR